jgi:hypothetical protein
MSKLRSALPDARGFSMIEALVAMGLLAVGLLGMAGVLAAWVRDMGEAPSDTLARQKAVEGIECVYTARDNSFLTWAQIRNVTNGGVFLNGAQPLRTPGDDGLVNTGDHGEDPEVLIQPGPDGKLGTGDDTRTPLTNYTRQILIEDISTTLRRLTVTVTVRWGGRTRQYQIVTLISAYV